MDDHAATCTSWLTLAPHGSRLHLMGWRRRSPKGPRLSDDGVDRTGGEKVAIATGDQIFAIP